MLGMFDNERPNPEAVERVKAYFVERFALPDDTLVSLAELRCHEPGCPPIETAITARGADGDMQDWRIHKKIEDIAREDVDALG